MITLYQLMHGGVDLDSERFVSSAAGDRTRGHAWKLKKPRAESRVRRCALGVRAINDWNLLPSPVVAATTLNMFKSRLDSHWSHLKYTVHIND